MRYANLFDVLVDFIATTDAASGSYDAVRAALEAATARRKAIESKVAALVSDTPSETPRLPTVEEISALCLDIEGHLRDDPTAFREFMRTKLLKDGKMIMEPLADGSYQAHSEILPLNLPPVVKAKSPLSRASGPVGPVSCGGRI